MILFCFLFFRNVPTIQNLDEKTFFPFFHSQDHISVVNFYEKDCPACLSSEDTFEELSRMYWLEPRVRFGQIDCDKYSDICESTTANDRPAWLVWFPNQPHSKRYNRNIDADVFERWLRQQTGIYAPAPKNSILYANETQVRLLKKRITCTFIIVDEPRSKASQQLHRECRSLEKKIKRGVRFFAINKNENEEFKSKLGDEEYGGFLLSKKLSMVQYAGSEMESDIVSFLKKNKCDVVMTTPSCTPNYNEEI